MKRCHICGCTEESPCITEEGPCGWAFETRSGHVCTACVVELPPDPKRERYPDHNLLIEKTCVNCAHIIEGALYKGGKSFTCSLGHFDESTILPGGHHWFAWSGITRPNKTVAEARKSCTEWKLHPRWEPSV